MRLTLLTVACLLSASAYCHGEKEHEHAAPAVTAEVDGARIYGEAMPAQPAPVVLAAVLASPDNYLAGEHKVSGRMGKVCQKAGCWMSLIEGEQQVRVVFGDHGFSIPTDSSGQAVVLGSLEKITLSEAQAKHMAEDAGADPSQVHGEQVEYRLIARSVAIKS